MKINISRIIIILSVLCLMPGCKQTKNLEFCEGISPEGTGVNCGEKFSTGEVTLLINSKTQFGSDKITLEILKKNTYRNDTIDIVKLDVNPESSSVKSNYYFYDEGEYIIIGRNGANKEIARGTIQVLDVY